MAILPLVGDHGYPDNLPMFDVYCPEHDGRTVLFSDEIEALVNRPGGVEVRWRCWCGHRGRTNYPRPVAAHREGAIRDGAFRDGAFGGGA